MQLNHRPAKFHAFIDKACLFLSCSIASPNAAPAAAAPAPRNIVFILTDDHRYDTMSFMGQPEHAPRAARPGRRPAHSRHVGDAFKQKPTRRLRGGRICRLSVAQVAWASCPCRMACQKPTGETPVPPPDNRDGLLVPRAMTTGEPAVFTVQEPQLLILTNTFTF